jgi:hypothetical protein
VIVFTIGWDEQEIEDRLLSALVNLQGLAGVKPCGRPQFNFSMINISSTTRWISFARTRV